MTSKETQHTQSVHAAENYRINLKKSIKSNQIGETTAQHPTNRGIKIHQNKQRLSSFNIYTQNRFRHILKVAKIKHTQNIKIRLISRYKIQAINVFSTLPMT